MERLRPARFGEQKFNNKQNNTANRPAQAISFGGSALSLTEKFVESAPVNKLVNFVDENEVAYNAIYSLFIAGILKPMVVIAQTGDQDKDGQIIATKNFVQAFIGTFLSLTIGGGFVKKIWNNLEANLKLFDIGKDDKLKTVSENSDKAKEIAKDFVIKDHNRIPDKIGQAKKMFNEGSGLKKVSGFFNGLFRGIDYKPSEEEVSSKAKELVSNFNKNHKQIFEKNPEYLKKLVKNMKEVELNPISAQNLLGKEQKSQLSDAFSTFWKRSSDVATVIAKAKISSLLLPTVMGILFAKKNAQAQAKKQEEQAVKNSSTLTSSKAYKETEEKFAAFKNGGNKNIAFTGFVDKALDKSVSVFENAAMSKPGEALVEGVSKLAKKPSARMSDVESIGLTAFWVADTAMSKKIDSDQKLGLSTHNILVTAISSVSALILDAITDPVVDKAKNTYLDKVKTTASEARAKLKEGADMKEIEKLVSDSTSKLFAGGKVKELLTNKDNLKLDPKELDSAIENMAFKYGKKLSKFKSLTIFTLVVRFLVPVMTVKLSKKVKAKLIEWSKNRKANKEQNNVQKTEAQKTQEAQKK